MVIRPISPDDVVEVKTNYIPDAIFEAFNEAIAKEYKDGVATIYQDDIMRVLTSDRYGFERHQIYDNKWLDVEMSYEESGWKVKYDKPAYCENYKAYFEFSRS